MKYTLYALMLIGLLSTVSAQSPEQELRVLFEHYLKGENGDITGLDGILHESFMMAFRNPGDGNKLATMNKQAFLSFVDAAGKKTQKAMKIVGISTGLTTASAEIHLTSEAAKLLIVNYYTLIKTDAGWQILSRTAEFR
jgi:hypothetical protein